MRPPEPYWPRVWQFVHASVLASELSLYYASEGKGKKALEKASRAVTLDPASGLAHHAMGMACECAGDNPGALQHYENAMAAVPQYGPSALAAATMWHAMDDRYAWHAKNLCRDALLWDPRNAEALLLLGKIEERMGNVDESKAHYLLGSRLAESMQAMASATWKNCFDSMSFYGHLHRNEEKPRGSGPRPGLAKNRPRPGTLTKC